jgi:hypothetical protein
MVCVECGLEMKTERSPRCPICCQTLQDVVKIIDPSQHDDIDSVTITMYAIFGAARLGDCMSVRSMMQRVDADVLRNCLRHATIGGMCDVWETFLQTPMCVKEDILLHEYLEIVCAYAQFELCDLFLKVCKELLPRCVTFITGCTQSFQSPAYENYLLSLREKLYELYEYDMNTVLLECIMPAIHTAGFDAIQLISIVPELHEQIVSNLLEPSCEVPSNDIVLYMLQEYGLPVDTQLLHKAAAKSYGDVVSAILYVLNQQTPTHDHAADLQMLVDEILECVIDEQNIGKDLRDVTRRCAHVAGIGGLTPHACVQIVSRIVSQINDNMLLSSDAATCAVREFFAEMIHIYPGVVNLHTITNCIDALPAYELVCAAGMYQMDLLSMLHEYVAAVQYSGHQLSPSTSWEFNLLISLIDFMSYSS